MSNSASVTVRDPRFHSGKTLKLYDRLPGGSFSPGQPSVGSARVRKDGSAGFDGLEEGATLWVVGEDESGTERAVAVTAKVEAPARKRSTAAAVRDRLAQTRPVVDNRTRVTGARGTRAVGRHGEPFANAQVGRPTEGKLPVEVHPSGRQEDAKGPQRSSTITGSAEPTAKDEPQPGLRQDRVPEGTPQRSATALGEATVIPSDELAQPGTKQEDAPEGLVQRSATPRGEITPLPVQPKPKKAKKAKRSPRTRRTNRTSTQQRRGPTRPKARSTKRKASGKTKRA